MTVTMATRGRHAVPGQAGAILDALGERAVVSDMYAGFGARVYHDIAGQDVHEIRELLTLVRRSPGPVLDLAAGTGRITLPLLGTGRAVTAVELSPDMLAVLRDRHARLPEAVRRRCDIVAADMSAFDLGRTYGAIVLGTTSISLLTATGRSGLYAAVRRHLSPGGRFLLTTVDVDPALAGDPEREFELRGTSGREYRFFEYIDVAAGHRKVTVFPREIEGSRVEVCTSTIRILPAAALVDELRASGLQVHACHPLPSPASRLNGVLIEAGRPEGA